MFIPRAEAEQIIIEAIRAKKTLKVTYRHTGDGATVTRTKAPFDIGTTNAATYHKYRDCSFMFCFDHRDEATRMPKPMVHAINITRIVSIEDTGNNFDPVELTDVNKRNTGYDYRSCRWAVVQDRNWY